MPKHILCNYCQAQFPRRRALQRHLALNKCPTARPPQATPELSRPSSPPLLDGPPPPDAGVPPPITVSASPAVVEATPAESCPTAQPALPEPSDQPDLDIDLQPNPPSISPTFPPVIPQTPAYRGWGPTPPERVDEPAQRPSTPLSTRGDVVRTYPRRRLHDTPPQHRVCVYLRRPEDGRHQERDTSENINVDVRRRLCDCAKCVSDAYYIVSSVFDRTAHAPRAVGVRFLLLPGIRTVPASHRAKQQLSRLLEKRPEMTWVICGCATCVAHRNLAGAWLRALAIPPSAERPAQEQHPHRQPHRRRRPPQENQRLPHRPEDVANRRRH